eukprot:905034-Prymnesium_polylepis.1
MPSRSSSLAKARVACGKSWWFAGDQSCARSSIWTPSLGGKSPARSRGDGDGMAWMSAPSRSNRLMRCGSRSSRWCSGVHSLLCSNHASISGWPRARSLHQVNKGHPSGSSSSLARRDAPYEERSLTRSKSPSWQASPIAVVVLVWPYTVSETLSTSAP